MTARKLHQTFNWAHWLSPAPTSQAPRVGFSGFLDWMGLTWGDNPAGGGGPYETITWTTIPDLHVDDRDIHVSSSTGSDAHSFGYDYGDGTFQGQITRPFETISGGRAALRDNHGDRLLLKKGDTFTNQVLYNNFGLRGYSAGRPMIFGAYGTGARPIIDSQASTTFYTNANVAHIWVVGLEITSTTYDGTGGRQGFGLGNATTVNDFLIEDCYIHEQEIGIVLNASSSRHSDFRLRGNVIYNSYNQAENSHGFIIGHTDTVLAEWNIFSFCGWNESKTGSTPNVHSRSMYIQSGPTTSGNQGCTAVTVRHNIMLDADGLQIRCGGVATGNVGSRLRVGIAAGTGNYLQSTAGGIELTCEDNVVLESKTHTGLGGCNAYEIGQIHYASTFKRNIAGRSIGNHATDDIKSFWFYHPVDNTLTCNAPLDFADNIFFHSGYLGISGDAAGYSTGANVVTFTNNDFQLDPLYVDNQCFRCDPSGILDDMVASGNNFFSSTPEVLLPTPDASTYWGEIAGANTAIATWVGATYLDDATATFTDHTSGFYTDPERTLGQYYVSLGHVTLGSETANHEGLSVLLRAQSKDTWDDALTAPAIIVYIKAGFA